MSGPPSGPPSGPNSPPGPPPSQPQPPKPSVPPSDPNNHSFFDDADIDIEAASRRGSARSDPDITLPELIYFRPVLDDARSEISSALSSEISTDNDDEKPKSKPRPDSDVPPPPPAKDDGYVSRPPTSTSARSDESRISVRKPVLKFVKWKGVTIELSPQPSDDPEDPLNWPAWKKDSAFYSLLFLSTLISASKTALIPANALMATTFAVPYATIAGLTALPLILAALSALACTALAKITGKRPLLLAAAALFALGTLLSVTSLSSLGAAFAARFFQGLAWGAVDALVLPTIYDLFFEHERHPRLAVHAAAVNAALWLSPVIGGAGVRNTARHTLPFEVLFGLLVPAVPLLLFAVPETSYARSWSSAAPTAPNAAAAAAAPPTASASYLQTALHVLRNPPPIMAFDGPSWSSPTILLQPVRALVAPTTLIVAATALLPTAALWGFANSLSLLFSAALSPAATGALLAGVFLMAAPLAAAAPLWRPLQRAFHTRPSAGLVAAGSLLAFVALLGFGLSVSNALPRDAGLVRHARLAHPGPQNYAALAVLLALLAAGVAVLHAIELPLLAASAQSSSASLFDGLKNTGDMAAGVAVWRNLFNGILAVGVPAALQTVRASAVVQSQAVGLAVTQLFVAAGAGAAWFLYSEIIRRYDGRVMGLVNISNLARSGSFFERD